MSDYSEKHDQLLALAKAQEQAAADAQAIQNFIRRHQEIIDTMATRRVIYDYFHGGEINESELEDAWANHPRFRRSLPCHQSETEIRAALAKEICELVAGSPAAKKHVVDQLKHKTIEEILAQRDELKRRQSTRSKTPCELREMIKRSHPAYQELPTLYQSRSMLLTLSGPEMAKFIKLYGIENINRALNKKEN